MGIRSQSYGIFWRRIHEKAKEKRLPLRAMFEITYRCNFNCRHCYVPEGLRKNRGHRELKTGEVFSILDQLKDMGCLYLGFTGGEPFLREDFLDILRYAQARGFEIIIYTNGSLIDEETADALKEVRLNKIDITINSLKKDPFESIARRRGSHTEIFRAIELLRNRNIPLGFKTCLLKDNEDEIADIRKFAESLNALHRLDTWMMPQTNGSKEPYRHRGNLNPVCLSGLVNRISEVKCNVADPPGRTESEPELFKCGVGLNNITINPFGEVNLCLMIDYPRYKALESSLGECWQRIKDLVDSIEADGGCECHSCTLKLYCRWCPALSWLANGKFSSCVPECRERAEYHLGYFAGKQALNKLE